MIHAVSSILLVRPTRLLGWRIKRVDHVDLEIEMARMGSSGYTVQGRIHGVYSVAFGERSFR